MFERVSLHGGRASIVSGWHPAAVLTWWRIDRPKDRDTWTLTGAVQWADAVSCRKPGLIFTAPRDKGMWAWGIEELAIKDGKIRARLGPPEQ